MASISAHFEPKTYDQAKQHECRRDAMKLELNALEENGTWIVVFVPTDQHIVGCKWVFKLKLRADASIERCKARLMAKGYSQIEGFDFSETFSPVAKHTTVRTFLALAAALNWSLCQLDIINAFLNGDLEEDVYMELPLGYEVKGECKPGERLVCKLQKLLYGLKQASRQWNVKLTAALLEYGFIQSKSDYSLFMKQDQGHHLYILVYVDDILVGSDCPELLSSFKVFLADTFKLRDLGVPHYFLGLELARSSQGIVLNQRKYVLDLLIEFGYLGSKPVKTPMNCNEKLQRQGFDDFVDATHYRKLVGKLLYLTFFGPDISFAAHVLSQYMDKPLKSHLQDAPRILRYLKQTPGQGLFFPANSDMKLVAYSDNDWASCVNTRRSISGFCIQLGGALISWKSKKQTVVARSSTEAEYRAMASCSCEIIWLVALLKDFGVTQPGAVVMHYDNQSAISLSKNPVYHERTKHVEIDCHFIREKVLDGVIELRYVHTSLQLADLFTKALSKSVFYSLLSKMSICNIHSTNTHLEGECQSCAVQAFATAASRLSKRRVVWSCL